MNFQLPTVLPVRSNSLSVRAPSQAFSVCTECPRPHHRHRHACCYCPDRLPDQPFLVQSRATPLIRTAGQSLGTPEEGQHSPGVLLATEWAAEEIWCRSLAPGITFHQSCQAACVTDTGRQVPTEPDPESFPGCLAVSRGTAARPEGQRAAWILGRISGCVGVSRYPVVAVVNRSRTMPVIATGQGKRQLARMWQ